MPSYLGHLSLNYSLFMKIFIVLKVGNFWIILQSLQQFRV